MKMIVSGGISAPEFHSVEARFAMRQEDIELL